MMPFIPVMIPQGFWVAARPPHPHGAGIFVDFMLSKKAQEIMAANKGPWGEPPRRQVSSRSRTA
jgi:ABC-type Fe3+ transport system substrate-binding protein